MRELSRRDFPEPDLVPDYAPAPIKQGPQRHRQTAATETAAMRRARTERATWKGQATTVCLTGQRGHRSWGVA